MSGAEKKVTQQHDKKKEYRSHTIDGEMSVWCIWETNDWDWWHYIMPEENSIAFEFTRRK